MSQRRILKEQTRLTLLLDPETTSAVRDAAARDRMTVKSWCESRLVYEAQQARQQAIRQLTQQTLDE